MGQQHEQKMPTFGEQWLCIKQR